MPHDAATKGINEQHTKPLPQQPQGPHLRNRPCPAFSDRSRLLHCRPAGPGASPRRRRLPAHPPQLTRWRALLRSTGWSSTTTSGEHVTTPVAYEQSPAVGGDHSPVWTNCGIYTKPIEQMRAVLSMEHGAVWITYRPDLPAAQLQKLTKLAEASGYVLLSRYPGQATRVTATVWGVQLALDTADDPRLRSFLTIYVQGEQTPEPCAPCTGGVDG